MSDIEALLNRLDEGYNGAMYTTLAAATIRQLQADLAASKNREDALKLRNEELKTEQEFFKGKETAAYNQARKSLRSSKLILTANGYSESVTMRHIDIALTAIDEVMK